jgi:hypothetical protein
MTPIDANVRSWFELVYFISGPIIAIFAVVGLIQVILLKKDMRVRAIRAAKERALEYSQRYANFVLLHREFTRECSKKKFPMYKGDVHDFSPNSLSSELKDIVKQKMRLDSGVAAMNELEAIAAAFVTGVADDATGFKIFGRSFCQIVHIHYDLLVVYDGETSNSHAQYTRELYKAWSDRLTEKELVDIRADARTRLESIARTQFVPIGFKEI